MSYLDDLRSDETNITSPALRGIVQNIMHSEPIILLGKSIQVVLQQDIILLNICENQVNLGSILTTVARTALDDSLDDLQHGRNTGTTSDHADMTAHVRGIHHSTFGALDLHGVADT